MLLCCIMARPTVMTELVLDKLRQAFLIGATNAEAAGYAGISVKTLYNYIENQPDFLQQIEAWKNEPILKAKTTVVRSLDEAKNAQWYLERKAADFKPKLEGTIQISPVREILEAAGLLEGETDDGQADQATDRPSQD